jgi:hypothetical protein
MGHLRLGRLPKTRRWVAVMQLLEAAPSDTVGVARAVVRAGDHRLSDLAHDPSLAYCFWLLTRVTWASRSADFAASLRGLGVKIDGDASALMLITQLNENVRVELAQHTDSGPFGELASLAFRRTLQDTVGLQGAGLFGSTAEDVAAVFRMYSTRTQFGLLAKRFFGDFFARTLRYFVDKELSNYVGAQHHIENINQAQEFQRALDLYARQSARIMEDFASGWYSKHNWQAKGEVSAKEAEGFVAIALRKLRMELTSEAPQV